MASPIEDSPRNLLEIGRIAARWSSLDLVMVKLLAETLQDEGVAEAMYFVLASQRARFDSVRAAVNASRRPSENEKVIISKIIEDLGDLWSKRNDLMHSPSVKRFKKGGKTEMFARVIRPANAKNNRREVSLRLAELKQHAGKLQLLTKQLFQIAYAREIRMVEDAKK
jgi:hypothetical protein